MLVQSLPLLALFLVGVNGWSFYQYAPYHYVRPNTSPVCGSNGRLPCHNVVLNSILDGPFNLIDFKSEDEFTNVYSIAGLSRSQAIAAGRKAIAYFRLQYGIELDHLRDDQLLSGSVDIGDGAMFQPFTSDPVNRFRLHTAVRNEQTQLVNKEWRNFGWRIAFTEDYQSKGIFSGRIPATALVGYGYFAMASVCDQPYGHYGQVPCANILNPSNPAAPISIIWKTRYYIIVEEEPNPNYTAECTLEHPIWGEGLALAFLSQRKGSNVFEGRHVMTFPASV